MLSTLFASLLLAVNVNFTPPMSHEISLAGNFGEPRPNHFHGGLDFRTEGVEGKPIMTIGDGYVSRITVGKFGFGNAVYVTHPEGYTSVYCHLQHFSPRMDRLVKQWQYAHEQYEADIRLHPTEYPVAQGQLIAFSGNTGHSFGPHLHLELHDTRTWDMLDPLEYLGTFVNDTVPPQIHDIIMNIDGTTEVEVKFLDQQLEDLYQEEFRFIRQVLAFSFICLLITLIGVFCLTMFETEYRRKEIGIRKILGSSESEVLQLLCRRYAILLRISFIVAAPVAWYIGNEWLQNFADRTPIYWWIFPLSFLLVSFVVLLTVIIQTWNVATMNPIESIRTE